MGIQKLSKRKIKGIKLMLERPEHNSVKEFKKVKKIKKSNRKKEVRNKRWDDLGIEDENYSEYSSFQKIRKVKDRYKPDSNKEAPDSSRKTFAREDTQLGRRREKGIIANLDQLVIITSIKSPPLKTGLIDRFLVTAEKNGFEVLICFNKIDLADREEDYIEDLGIYSNLDYRVILTSVVENAGIKDLRKALKDKCSLFIGHSGVGKSSLLNAVEPGLKLKVSHISESTNKGRHTTTSKKLHSLSFGGEVLDAPGIKQLGLIDVNKKELSAFFPEFRHKSLFCSFSDCSHVYEKNCAIKKEVAAGNISKKRYDSYVRIWKTI